MPANDAEKFRRRRHRGIQLLLAVRGLAFLILATGAAILSLRREWLAVAFCAALILINAFLTYKALNRFKKSKP
jgi:hypothetical protein